MFNVCSVRQTGAYFENLMTRPSPIPGIARIDQPSHRTHGFFVRISRLGKTYSAFFSDKKFGGKARALAVSKKYYLKLKKLLGVPHKQSRRFWAETVRRRGKSGIHGVSRVISRRPGGVLKYWMAAWSPELGVYRRKRFSIRKFGEEKAKALAIRARRAGLRSMK